MHLLYMHLYYMGFHPPKHIPLPTYTYIPTFTHKRTPQSNSQFTWTGIRCKPNYYLLVRRVRKHGATIRGNWTSGTVLPVDRHEVDSGSCVQIRNLTQDGIDNMEYLPGPQTDALSMCNLGVRESNNGDCSYSPI